jgi:hypothetical protein
MNAWTTCQQGARPGGRCSQSGSTLIELLVEVVYIKD